MNRNPHLTTSSTATGREVLKIFENFVVDTGLPRHAGSVTHSSGVISWATSGSILTVGQSFSGSISPRQSLFARLWDAIRDKAVQLYLQRTATPVEEIFAAIIGRGKKLEVLVGRQEAHRAAIAEARAMGQTALAEELEERSHMVEMEAVLYAAGYREYIEEEQLIEFASQCERGLQLDWVKNFTRLIPEDVRLRKVKLDALQVMDNYVVLHYDPAGKNSALTKQEIEKKKDPILFGVIRGSRRLYHVGSWKDPFCTLTFGDLIDKFGSAALSLK